MIFFNDAASGLQTASHHHIFSKLYSKTKGGGAVESDFEVWPTFSCFIICLLGLLPVLNSVFDFYIVLHVVFFYVFFQSYLRGVP